MSESVVLYGLEEDGWDPFLTDYERALRTPFINGIYNPLLNDKLVFHHSMVSLGAPTPAVYGLVTRDLIAWNRMPAGVDERDFDSLVRNVGEVVLKPVDGGLGDRVSFVSWQDDRLVLNGAAAPKERFDALLRPGTLICERIHQGRYAEDVFDKSTNTLRLITMWDYSVKAPFLAAAEHRFGTERSAPVDNTSKGGVFSGIDMRTGEVTKASRLAGGRLIRFGRHPDTGSQIEGIVVPNWDRMCAEIVDVAARLAHVPYIGWDVVVGDDDYHLIEGNTYPDAQTQAVTGPWLTDPRVRRFYEHHGVLRGRRRRSRPNATSASSPLSSARARPTSDFARQGETRAAPRR